VGDDVNVLLIALEGARPDHFSCAGYERETTPFIDQIAREGVRFPFAFTTAGSRLGAYASMLTGLWPSLHGATEETGTLTSPTPLLPELLKANGYRTAVFGPDALVSPARGLGRGFDRCSLPRRRGRLAGRAAAYARRASDRVLGRADAGAARTTQALLEWIESAGEPFFALVRYREAVRPYRVPAPYDRVFTSRPHSPRPAAGESDASRDSVMEQAALHDGALRYLDSRVRQIADALDAHRWWQHTLCIVTGDVAQELAAHPPAAPTALCDAVLRVPLLVRCPGSVPAGFVVEEFAQPSDLLPTITALTGCPTEVAVQGRALLTRSGVTSGPAAIVAEAFRCGDVGVRRKALRTRREKLIWQSDEANALYDVVRDPQEQHNRAPEDPERADQLRRLLFDLLADAQRELATGGERLPTAVGARREAGE
jgi:arylsulfatase A-like enzyme